MNCRVCEIRASRKLGPCPRCAPRPQALPREPAHIASAEPAPAETFDPVDVLETSLRQARAVQRRLQALIDSGGDVGELNDQHAKLARSIGQLVPTWQDLTAANVKKQETLTVAEEESAFLFWFEHLEAPKRREIWQKQARIMNGEATG